MPLSLSFYAGWIGILLGFFAGAVPGLFFHDPGWLGGYASWARRMVRLAHISFFGLGFVNLAFGLTAPQVARNSDYLCWVSGLLLLGAATMPIVCYLAAFRPSWRHLFFIPVGSLILGVGLFLYLGLIR